MMTKTLVTHRYHAKMPMKKPNGNSNDVAAPQSVEGAFAQFAKPLIEEAQKHAGSLDANPDAEVLHKLRVSLRRLRTLLWAYRPVLDRDFDAGQREIYKSLASAAGNTRDWDILIALVQDSSDADLRKALRAQRADASRSSRDTLAHANIRQVLTGALQEAEHELAARAHQTPLKKFASRRLKTATGQLNKRMRRAKGASDYACYHEVRKAGKKVRYLLEFFEPYVKAKQRKGLKKLKKLQKRFGALNDVVASRELLHRHLDSLPQRASRQSLRELEKEQKRRLRSAAKLL
ncbi:MAG TPA: CHAD domain-containing protein [Paraburkholderia sp.]|jgi:CHAD domain-containing protein|nr:CHAD domain-containing protein [Paraburkholderia sp.]